MFGIAHKSILATFRASGRCSTIGCLVVDAKETFRTKTNQNAVVWRSQVFFLLPSSYSSKSPLMVSAYHTFFLSYFSSCIISGVFSIDFLTSDSLSSTLSKLFSIHPFLSKILPSNLISKYLKNYTHLKFKIQILSMQKLFVTAAFG